MRGRIDAGGSPAGAGAPNVRRLVGEAAALGFRHVFFTGGEPFILEEIYDMLAYASARLPTTVLTSAVLLRGKRLDQLCAIANHNLTVQVSLDGARPEHNDPFRGQGSWARTVEGLRLLTSRGLRVCISTTETPANAAHIEELRAFVGALGIGEEDHFVRPMARRGFAQEGVEVGMDTLVPEVTVTAGGVYWHPLISPNASDMQVTQELFPLADAVEAIRHRLHAGGDGDGASREEFV